MRLPISWLKEYVDYNDTPQGLAEKLTLSGTEVEGIETVGGTFEGVVVGEILRVEKHPNADKLTLCTVNTGTGEVTVVCGAPNARAGMMAPFAPAGVTLPNGLKLEKRKVRGVESCGMLCAEDELKLSDDHTGLMELDAGFAPGTPLAEVLGPPDTVLELEITPNRPDCLSVLGIAREVAALYGTKVRRPEVALREEGDPVEKQTSVEIRDADGCPRYTARILKNVKIGPSPAWMKRRLEMSGIRAINNVVDITNYVMLECGQPLHAFDQKLLKEGRIVVRRFGDGEKLATLDGVERPMDAGMLVIADARRPVAVAGVMGGAGSEIHDDTETVLLESAFFKPQDNRATSKRLGLSTESSYRFERGVDIESVEWASRRAAALMVEHAGAVAAPGVLDEYPVRHARRQVVCRVARLHDLLGVKPGAGEIKSVFEALELPVVSSSGESCTVEIPAFRVDIEMEADLIEEFARIHGLDKLPIPPPRSELVPGANDRVLQAALVCREHLVGLGLREIMNYSFVADGLLDLFDPSDRPRRVALTNPVNMEQSMMRTSLVPQMVETLGRNLAHQVGAAALFEIGRVFFQGSDGHPAEEDRLVIGLMGPVGRSGLDHRRAVKPEEMFLWVKGIWESLAGAQRIGDFAVNNDSRPWGEEGSVVSLTVDGEAVGVLGLVKSSIRSEWRMLGPVGILEVSLAPILRHVFDGRSFAPIATYPCVVRDAAFVVEDGVKHEDVLKIVQKAAPKELERVELFDIFKGEGISTGHKSMAYSFRYRSSERTLTDEEANRYHEAVKAALRKELGVDVREG
jgi:phenylalanyl-tRNA synthetase beta chain